jgi:hypothetical protein
LAGGSIMLIAFEALDAAAHGAWGWIAAFAAVGLIYIAALVLKTADAAATAGGCGCISTLFLGYGIVGALGASGYNSVSPLLFVWGAVQGGLLIWAFLHRSKRDDASKP